MFCREPIVILNGKMIQHDKFYCCINLVSVFISAMTLYFLDLDVNLINLENCFINKFNND